MPVEFSSIHNDFREHADFTRFTDAWLSTYASSETNLFKLTWDQQLEKVIAVIVQQEEEVEKTRRSQERKRKKPSKPKGPYGPGTQFAISGWGNYYKPPRKKAAKGDAILVPQLAADGKCYLPLPLILQRCPISPPFPTASRTSHRLDQQADCQRPDPQDV
jgi:hypothetical protein